MSEIQIYTDFNWFLNRFQILICYYDSMDTRSPRAIAVETIAMVLLVVLVLIVAVSLAQVPQNNQQKLLPLSLRVQNLFIIKCHNYKNGKIWTTKYGKVFLQKNTMAFHLTKGFYGGTGSISGSGVQSGRFQGEVLSVELNSGSKWP